MARVIVVGAGVGGLTLAQGLRRAGFDVAVYERDGFNGRPQGIALHIDDRGVEALRACLPPEQLAMAEGTMGGPRVQTLHISEVDGALEVVGSRPSDGASGGARPGRQASRPLLRAVLLAGLEDAVRFESELIRFEQEDDGTVKAWFSDGRTDTGDVLVGADGVGSAVRAQYLPQAQVVDTGKRMLMGATPLRAIAETGLAEMIGHGPASVQVNGTMLMALGPLWFSEAPSAARDRWLPSLRSPAVDDAEDYIMWAIPATKEAVPADGSPEAVWDTARELTAAMHPSLRLIVEEAWPEVTFPHRLGVIPPLPAWPATSVTLIGDAIHLAPGFGANLAMQDARRLCEALAGSAGEPADLVAAIGAYEEQMREESFQLAKAFAPKPPPKADSGDTRPAVTG